MGTKLRDLIEIETEMKFLISRIDNVGPDARLLVAWLSMKSNVALSAKIIVEEQERKLQPDGSW